MRRSASPGGTLKRKRDSPDFTHSRASPTADSKTARLGASSSSFTKSRLSHSTSVDDRSSAKNYRSPDSDELQQSDSGDTLRGIGSASSLASTASSVFSSNSHAFAAHNRKASHANGLTPLTSHSDSSPPKPSSPPPKSSAQHTMASAAAGASRDAPATHTRKELRPNMLPPSGKAKGYRVVWDPELDGKLSREERKRATIRKREFGTEVRNTFHNLLSLRNRLIPITLKIC